MKNWKKFLKRRATPALMLLALAAFAVSTAQAQNSAAGSKNSGTDAKSSESRVVSGEAERAGSPRVSKGADLSVPPAVAGGLTQEAQSPGSKIKDPRSQIQPDDLRALINSCAAAVEDLAKTRILAEALERENGLLRERLDTEKRASAVLLEINETRKSEAVSLRETVAAKNEALSAKDQVIAAQDKLIDTLRKKKTSPLKRLGDVLLGVGLMAVLR